MPNGFENFAQNAIALGDTWRQRRQQKQLATAMGKFDTDPNAAVAGVTAVDPTMGYNMRRQIASDAESAANDKRTQATETLKTVTGLLRPAVEMPGANPDSIGKAYDAVTPMLSSMGMGASDIAQWRNMVTTNPSILQTLDDKLQVVPPGAAVTRGGKEVYRNAMAPKTMVVHRGDGGSDVITIDPNTGHPVVNGGGAPAAAAPATAPGKTTASQAWGFTGPAEGGYSSADANGLPVNHGINAKFYKPLPGFPADVKDLTPEQAQQYFDQNYFQPSGAANMPPALGVLHSDTYYINPRRAQQFLKESGGDPQKYLQLRAAWQDNLVKSDPQRYGKYAESWDNRNQALARQIGSANASGGGVDDSSGGPQTVYSTPGKPAPPAKAGSTFLTDQEVAAAGLNPNVKWQRNHLGDVVMVGPAAQLKTANDSSKRGEQFQILNNGLDRLRTVATGLLNHDGLERAVGDMSYFPSIRGGAAKDFENQLKALKSQVIVNVLQMMRQASPTGSAMGRVTNYEAQQLQQDIGNLDVTNSPQQMRANLQKVIQFADDMKGQYSRAYNTDSSTSGNGKATLGGTAAPPKEAIDMLRSNPSPQRRQQFDQIFGNGAAAKFVATRPNNFSQKMPVGQQTPFGTRY